MHTKNSGRWLMALLSVNLLLGIAIGILVDQHFLTSAEADSATVGERPAEPPRGHRHEQRPRKDRIIGWMTDQLELTESQQAALGTMLEQHRAAEKDYHLKRREEFKQMRGRFMDQIAEVLTEDQLARFQEMRQELERERQERMQRMRERWSRTRPPDGQEPAPQP